MLYASHIANMSLIVEMTNFTQAKDNNNGMIAPPEVVPFQDRASPDETSTNTNTSEKRERQSRRQILARDTAKATIAEWLKLPMNNSWNIVDREESEGLYMINYNEFFPDVDKDSLSWIRGLVLHLPSRQILVRSYGYSKTVVMDEIPIAPFLAAAVRVADPAALQSDPTLASFAEMPTTMNLMDENNNGFLLDTKNAFLKPGYEGMLLRIWKWNGKVYRSTHRKLNFDRSHFGQSKSFVEMYNDVHGPTDEELFEESETTSPFVYYALLVHSDLFVATKSSNMTSMVWLGVYPMVSAPAENQVPRFVLPPPKEAFTDPFMLPSWSPSPISVPQANLFLSSGHWNLPREHHSLPLMLKPGEFVVVYGPPSVPGSPLPTITKIVSTSYQWRSKIRDNSTNLTHQFYTMLDYAKLPREQYPFPALETPSANLCARIRSGSIVVAWEMAPASETYDHLATVGQRISNNWRCLLAAVPIFQQVHVIDILSKYHEDLRSLVEYITAVYRSRVLLNRPDAGEQTLKEKLTTIIGEVREDDMEQAERLRSIISSAHKQMKIAAGGERLKMRDWNRGFMNEVRNILHLEGGISLYRLNRFRTKYAVIAAESNNATTTAATASSAADSAVHTEVQRVTSPKVPTRFVAGVRSGSVGTTTTSEKTTEVVPGAYPRRGGFTSHRGRGGVASRGRGGFRGGRAGAVATARPTNSSSSD